MNKKDFRVKQISALKEFSTDNRKMESKQILDSLFQSESWKSAQTVATTLSDDLEFDTKPVIQQAQLENKTIVVPRTTIAGRKMFFNALTANTRLERTKFGILEPVGEDTVEPEQIDLIVVPGLGFETKTGFRVGFGAGYYDRYLADYNGKTVGLALTPQLLEKPEWPVDGFDIDLEQIISKDGVVYEK
ncbi:5-formyltetrahydrofolate cyclo-ligase [Pediococcus argentinicus]|uniref:5-formyltetrahydrofolate cyclo-ligase n=1 Tax=Pediococcus argentinicus TaxID=480391 RepID=A0A0R2NQC1_9LACO|nr:5-formyltetrahydrofolate cyclo-ligase [Pediococcus argentinicus]KRO25386.1 5-formyltetrahydrofolate cyclo-ligase [Pediococcus argentinicus]NKZ22304.1 5-formyltetrahydrofolate cyclo-ligase [Pediococcus argentinicus]GEP19331.1 5-formyltetrahydrofolate cyclo-ligase [Pediococcus argentinicus]